jgi:hypothetical protein
MGITNPLPTISPYNETVVSFIIHSVEQETPLFSRIKEKFMKKALHRDVILILDLGITSTATPVLLSTDSVSFIHSIDSVLIGIALKMVERLENSIFAPEDVAVDEV